MKFSIIMVHYQGCTDDSLLLRAVDCVMAQTFKDFELLIYHNGPLLKPEIVEALAARGTGIRCMDQNYNDWGFSRAIAAFVKRPVITL